MTATQFKETEIGMIPQEWEVLKLWEISDIKSWKARPKNHWAYPVYGGNGILDYADDYNIDEKSIIIGRVWAYCWCVYLEKNKFWLSDNALWLLNNQKSDINFLYYLLTHLNLNTKSIWWAQPLLTQGILKEIEIPLPPLPEQQAIASTLGSLDDKIELLREQNKTLEAIGQATFKSRFVDFDGVTEFEDSELGPIPKGWKVGKLGEILNTIESGRRPKWWIDNTLEEWVPSIWAENIIWLWMFDYWKDKLITRDFFNSMSSGVIKNYDVLLYKDWASLWRKSMFWNWFPFKECCINEHVFILRTNELLNQEYLYFWIDLPDTTERIINLNSNAAQPGINQVSVKSLNIIIPNKDILKDFQSQIKPSIDKIFSNCLQILSLTQTRDSLLPKLMSGKVRVV